MQIIQVSGTGSEMSQNIDFRHRLCSCLIVVLLVWYLHTYARMEHQMVTCPVLLATVPNYLFRWNFMIPPPPDMDACGLVNEDIQLFSGEMAPFLKKVTEIPQQKAHECHTFLTSDWRIFGKSELLPHLLGIVDEIKRSGYQHVVTGSDDTRKLGTHVYQTVMHHMQFLYFLPQVIIHIKGGKTHKMPWHELSKKSAADLCPQCAAQPSDVRQILLRFTVITPAKSETEEQTLYWERSVYTADVVDAPIRKIKQVVLSTKFYQILFGCCIPFGIVCAYSFVYFNVSSALRGMQTVKHLAETLSTAYVLPLWWKPADVGSNDWHFYVAFNNWVLDVFSPGQPLWPSMIAYVLCLFGAYVVCTPQ